jgi:hypothetical protein
MAMATDLLTPLHSCTVAMEPSGEALMLLVPTTYNVSGLTSGQSTLVLSSTVRAV